MKIKFVFADGISQITNIPASLTVKDVHALKNDMKASWFSLLDGDYRKDPIRKTLLKQI